MIVTFCGHSQFTPTQELKEKLLSVLEAIVADTVTDFYLGGYGAFDGFAYATSKEYQRMHRNISLIFVTPYMSLEYQKKHLEYNKTRYDAILYPEIEDKPLRFAITYRNRYMVEKADIVIAYVEHTWGGAYKTFQYAIRKKKKIINLAENQTQLESEAKS